MKIDVKEVERKIAEQNFKAREFFDAIEEKYNVALYLSLPIGRHENFIETFVYPLGTVGIGYDTLTDREFENLYDDLALIGNDI